MTLPRLLRPQRWTLRGRLVAGRLALLAVLCLVIGVVSVSVLHNQVLNQVDRQLSAASQRTGNGGDGPGGFGGTRPRPLGGNGAEAIVTLAGQPAGTLGAIIVGGAISTAGTQTGNPDSPFATVSNEDYPALVKVTADNKPHTIHLDDLGSYRVLATKVTDGTAANSVQLIGVPLKDANSTVYNLAIAISIVSLIGLLGAGIAGRVIVRLALRPLRRVAD